MAVENSSKIKSVALVNEQRSRGRDLSGFRKKSHQVPNENNDRTQQFVGRIAEEEIGADLDERFAEFRRAFPFKRVDLKVSDPDNGTGAISTPWFDYRITVTVADDDPSEAVWRRQVTDFRDPEPLLSSEFATVFGNMFDTIRFEPPEAITIEEFIDAMEDRDDKTMTIDYDRTSTWCQLSLENIPGQLLVESDCVSLTTNQPQLPARLLEAFFRFREELTGIEWF